MMFLTSADIAGVPLTLGGLQGLIALYAAKADALVRAAAVYTRVVDDLKQLAANPAVTRGITDPSATPTAPVTPAAPVTPVTPATAATARRTRAPLAPMAAIAAIRSGASRIDPAAGDGYDPIADARSVAAMLRAKEARSEQHHD